MEEIEQKNVTDTMYEFIRTTFPRARQKSLSMTDKLLEGGVIDSLDLLTLIDFIETTYGITVSDTDVGDENFSTINTISAFINRSLEKQ
ncbi:MAG: acyl carrier protein [Sedimentisphaerales bacterium]|nr:acyl carrier protein [Sedimentisphaerales bacterium]